MNFDWNAAFYTVMAFLTLFGVPGLIFASIWAFMDEHPFIGAFLAILTLSFIAFLSGLPEEVF